MSITVQQDLQEWNPVRNEIPYEVAGTDLVDDSGEIGFSAFLFNEIDMPGEGDTLEIYYDPGYTLSPVTSTLMYTITFTATPDDSGFEVPLFTGGSVEDYVTDELLPKLQALWWLWTNFDVQVYSSGGIQVTARALGPWNVLWNFVGGYTISFYTSTGGEYRTFFENAGILFQVWVEDPIWSDNFVMALEEAYAADFNSRVKGYFEDLLRDYVQPMMPDPDMTTAIELVDAYTRFYIRTAERLGDPIVIAPMTQSDTKLAYLAGRSEDMRVEFPDWRDQLLNGVNDWKFHSAWPNTTEATAKRVTPQQREFLAVIIRSGLALDDFELTFAIDYTDGTSTTATLEAIDQGTDAGVWYLFAVGVEQRDLDEIDSNKTIHRYNVRLVGSGSNQTVSEIRYFIVDHAHHENYRQLHYFNSQGGVDTLALTGERENKPTVEIEVSDRFTKDATTLHEARAQVATMREMSDDYQVGAAYLTIEELEAVKDLPASELVVERVGDEHWPVRILSTKGPDTDEANSIRSFEVRYRFDFNNHSLSP